MIGSGKCFASLSRIYTIHRILEVLRSNKNQITCVYMLAVLNARVFLFAVNAVAHFEYFNLFIRLYLPTSFRCLFSSMSWCLVAEAQHILIYLGCYRVLDVE